MARLQEQPPVCQARRAAALFSWLAIMGPASGRLHLVIPLAEVHLPTFYVRAAPALHFSRLSSALLTYDSSYLLHSNASYVIVSPNYCILLYLLSGGVLPRSCGQCHSLTFCPRIL